MLRFITKLLIGLSSACKVGSFGEWLLSYY